MAVEGERPANLKELLLLLLVAFALLAPGISGLPPVDRDEPRYAVATTQMLQSQNFIDIRYQNQPRYLQPAGVYWLQSIPTALFSAPGHRHIWTYRIPSLLGAAFAVVFAAWMASRVFGRRMGLATGVFLAACLSLGFEARIGKTDASLLAMVVVAQFVLMRAYLGLAPSRRMTAAFWAALGGGVLLKGPIILLVVGLTVLALIAWDRRAAWLKSLRPAWGLPLMLLIAAPWYIAIGMLSHGEFFKIAVGRSLMGKVAAGQQAHGAPFGYHLVGFPLTFWPASLVAVMAIPFAWRERRRPEIRFLLCWIIPSWIVFELVKTKLPHYVLPLFPAIACLTAVALFSPKVAVRPWLRWALFVFAAVWAVLSAALSIAGPAALWIDQHHVDPLAVLLSLCSLASVAALAWCAWRRQAEWAVAAAACATLFTATNVYANALPRLSSFWLSPRIIAVVDTVKPCPDSLLISTPDHEPSLVFLNGPSHTYLADKPGEAADALAKAGACGLAVVGGAQDAAFLTRAAQLHLRTRMVGWLQGRDYSDNRSLKLSFYTAAPSLPAAPSNGR
jgi:4-amino-4-deoxy-L-arabinose transferase-like glycosyltransferase